MPAITDSLLQSFGALSLPAEASDLAAGALTSLDTGRDKLLALMASAINSELGEAWAAAMATLPASHSLDGSRPVQDTLPHEPSVEQMTQRKGAFPMLTLTREGSGTFEEHTLEKSRLVQQWSLAYILSPLDALDKRKLGDVLSAIPKIVALVIKRRGHASYENGALQFFGADSAFASVRLVSYQIGNVEFAEGSGTFWNICEMALETVELTGWREGAFGDVEAADYTVGVGSDEGIQPALVVASSDHEPSAE